MVSVNADIPASSLAMANVLFRLSLFVRLVKSHTTQVLTMNFLFHYFCAKVLNPLAMRATDWESRALFPLVLQLVLISERAYGTGTAFNREHGFKK